MQLTGCVPGPGVSPPLHMQGVGIEITFPLHSPVIGSIQVIRRGRVRRAKLYYLRERLGKNARLKELIIKKKVVAAA